jgi:tetratricopeptide (TPR) repeat protein
VSSAASIDVRLTSYYRSHPQAKDYKSVSKVGVSKTMSVLKSFLFVAAPLVSSLAQVSATSEPVKVAVQPPVTTVLSPAIPEAIALYQSGKFEAAADKYRQILTVDPKNAEAYVGLTRSLLKEKNAEDARATIDKAIQTADSPAVRVALGEVKFREGSLAGAEREWANVINSGHREGRAYLGIARVSTALSLHKRAKTMLEKAHAADPNDADIRKAWMSTLSRSERIKYLEDYLSQDNADDEETRAHMRHYLEYLRGRLLEPKRGCHLVSKTTSTETAMLNLMSDAQHLRGYGLEVVFGDRKSKLLLDTGAGGILINRRMAEKAGLKQLSQTTMGGLGDKGEAKGYVALAPSIKVGGLEFQDCPVEVIDRRSVVDEDGLIGADVFERFLVELDFAHQKLRLSELPKRPEQSTQDLSLSSEEEEPNGDTQLSETHEKPDATPAAAKPAEKGPFDRYIAPEMKDYSQIIRFGHLLLIPTWVNDEKTAKFFLIDSGGFTTTLSLNAAKAATKVHDDPRLHVRGLSGETRKVYVADKATLLFAQLRQPTEDVTVLDLKHLSDSTGTEVSGIIGFTSLRFLDIKIDYRDGLVSMDYQGPKWMVQ